MGYIMGVHYFNAVLLGFISEPISNTIGNTGIFLLFGIITTIGYLFINKYVYETKDLTDYEKKHLYHPASFTKVADIIQST